MKVPVKYDYKYTTANLQSAWVHQSEELNEEAKEQKKANDQSAKRRMQNSGLSGASECEEKEQKQPQSQIAIRNANLWIISPITVIIVLSLLKKFRNIIDCDFLGADAVHGADQEYTRFNETFYAKHHKPLDCHQFVELNNGQMIIPGHVVLSADGIYYYIRKFSREIPIAMRHANKTKLQKAPVSEWIPDCFANVYELTKISSGRRKGFEIVNKTKIAVKSHYDWLIVRQVNYNKFWMKSKYNRQYWIEQPLLPPQWQAADVDQKKFFLFIRGAYDAFNWSNFTKFSGGSVKSYYWTICNSSLKLQNRAQFTWMITGANSRIKDVDIGSECNAYWQYLAAQGALTVINNNPTRVFGQLSHIGTDLECLPVFARNRGTSKDAKCDGKLYCGVREGAGFSNHLSLTNMNNLKSGIYLWIVWKWLGQELLQERPRYFTKFNKQWGCGLSVSTEKKDIWNDWNIDSCGKCTMPWHHICVVGGVLPKMLHILWNTAHSADGLNEVDSLKCLEAIMHDCFDGVNGIKFWLADYLNNIFVANHINKCWSKYMQLVVCIESVVGSRMKVWCSMVRLCMAITNVKTDNQRRRLYKISQKVFKQASDTLHYAFDGHPKSRYLKQIFIDLARWNIFSLFDDIHQENPHVRRKYFKQRKENYKLADNENLMRHELIETALSYAVNGGRWGPDLDYKLGSDIRNAHDPYDPSLPHPFIIRWVFPTRVTTKTVMQITKAQRLDMSDEDNLMVTEIREDASGILREIIAANWGIRDADIFDIPQIKVSVILRWKYRKNLQSMFIDVTKENFKRTHLKLTTREIFVGDMFIWIAHELQRDDLYVMKGQVWNLTQNPDGDNWEDLGLGSLDFINGAESHETWRLMTSIEEPVLLLHDHFHPHRRQRQRWPEDMRHLRKQEFKMKYHQNMYTLQENNVSLEFRPCGPVWCCKQHNVMWCNDTPCKDTTQTRNLKYWRLKWHCNADVERRYFVWDGRNGFLPGLGDTSHRDKVDDDMIYV